MLSYTFQSPSFAFDFPHSIDEYLINTGIPDWILDEYRARRRRRREKSTTGFLLSSSFDKRLDSEIPIPWKSQQQNPRHGRLRRLYINRALPPGLILAQRIMNPWWEKGLGRIFLQLSNTGPISDVGHRTSIRLPKPPWSLTRSRITSLPITVPPS